jgi:uncharacterized membrane protein
MVLIKGKAMLSEREKVGLIITMVASASLIQILILLYDLSDNSYFSNVLFDIGFTRWGWILSSVLSVAAIAGTLHWKAGSQILRVIVMLLSVITIILSSLWFLGAYFITHLTP